MPAIALSKIRPSRYQMRKDFDKEGLAELAQSMKTHGLLEPVVARSVGSSYELIAGERRVRAAKMLGWREVDAVIVQVKSEADAAAKGIIENIQRQDVNPMEEAEGFAVLQKLDKETWTQESIGKTVGKDRTYITRSLGLLSLPEAIQRNVRYRTLSRHHAIEIARLSDPAQQLAMARQIPGRLTVEETRKLVNGILGQKINGKSKSTESRDKNAGSRPDPLRALWVKLLGDSDIGPKGAWGVDYAKGGRWTFWMQPEDPLAPQTELARWLARLAGAVSAAVDSRQERKEAEAFKEKWMPKSMEEFDQMRQESKRIRLPQNAAEMAGLEALALKGPGAVYGWIYGEGSKTAAQIRGQSWKDLGSEDPAQAVRDFVGFLRSAAKAGR